MVTVVDALRFKLSLPAEYAKELATEAMEMIMVEVSPLSRVRKLAGKCSWTAGFIPAMGARIAPLWAAVADCRGAPPPVATRGQVQLDQPGVPTVRIKVALRWIFAFATGQRGALQRTFDARMHIAQACVTMEFDASPWGTVG